MTQWILVVEDEAPLGEMLCDNLQSQGYGVELCVTGTAALERIAKGGLDLIVLDIMLPGQDGFSILEAMRGRGDRTPVMIVSARASDADRIRGLELHADDYLTKPFNLKELLLRVAACCGATPSLRATRTPWSSRATASISAATRRLPTAARRHGFPRRDQAAAAPGGRENEVVPRRELVDHLFGPHTPTTTRSLDNTVLRLRRLFERSREHPRHILTVRGVGLRFCREETP